MIRLRVSLTAFCLCLCANAMSVLPAYPSEEPSSAGNAPVSLAAVPSGALSIKSNNTSDVCPVYDSIERKWKRWSVLSESRDGVRKSVVRMSVSEDGKTWAPEAEPCFQASEDSSDWDYGGISAPNIVLRPEATPERRYMLWYCGFNGQRRRLSGSPDGAIGLAFSADGRKFTRLPPGESPFKRPGMVLSGRQPFADVPAVWEGALGEPKLVVAQGTYHIWFSKIGLSRSGQIISAGIGHATSGDGIRWSTELPNPLTFHFDNKRMSCQYLTARLHNLSEALSESMSTQ